MGAACVRSRLAATELRAAWDQVAAEDRAAIEAALVAVTVARLAPDPWYPGTMQKTPRVEVLGARKAEGRVTVFFVADHLTYCVAQSGSDWAEHYIFVGQAVVEGKAVASHEETRTQHSLSERDTET